MHLNPEPCVQGWDSGSANTFMVRNPGSGQAPSDEQVQVPHQRVSARHARRARLLADSVHCGCPAL